VNAEFPEFGGQDPQSAESQGSDLVGPVPIAPEMDPVQSEAQPAPDHGAEAGLPSAGSRGVSRLAWLGGCGLGLIGALVALAFVWNVWDAPSTLVAQIKDARGLDLVEDHAQLLRAAALESDVDACLLAGIMYSESRGRGGQTSHKGALGLMQLSMAAAGDSARRLKLDKPTAEQLLEDADLNVRLAADHLFWLQRHAGDWDQEAVLVSYNAGRSRLFDWISDAGGSYGAWRQRELQRKKDGERTTGALDYALQTLAARDAFLARGVIVPEAAEAVPKD
jgi:soluble lytic murein transglycosylase-like protein